MHRTEKTHGICSDLASAKKMMEKRQKVVCSPSSRTKPCCFRQKVCYPEAEPWYLDFEPWSYSTISSGSSANFHPISPLFLIGYFVAQMIFPIQHVGIDISLFNMFPIPYIQHFGIIFVPI